MVVITRYDKAYKTGQVEAQKRMLSCRGNSLLRRNYQCARMGCGKAIV
jgi:hypothetical protein